MSESCCCACHEFTYVCNECCWTKPPVEAPAVAPASDPDEARWQREMRLLAPFKNADGVLFDLGVQVESDFPRDGKDLRERIRMVRCELANVENRIRQILEGA